MNMHDLPGSVPRKSLPAFVLAAVALFVTFYVAYLEIPDDVLRLAIYPNALGRPAAAVIDALVPAEHVRVDANRLLADGTSLGIVRGCDGAGVLFLLVAAIAAYPAPRLARVRGALAACGFVYVLNEGRITLLYFVLAHRHLWFTTVHEYLLPTFLIAASCAFFMRWSAKAGAGGPS